MLEGKIWTDYFLLLDTLRGRKLNYQELHRVVALFFESFQNRLEQKKLPKPRLPH